MKGMKRGKISKGVHDKSKPVSFQKKMKSVIISWKKIQNNWDDIREKISARFVASHPLRITMFRRVHLQEQEHTDVEEEISGETLDVVQGLLEEKNDEVEPSTMDDDETQEVDATQEAQADHESQIGKVTQETQAAKDIKLVQDTQGTKEYQDTKAAKEHPETKVAKEHPETKVAKDVEDDVCKGVCDEVCGEICDDARDEVCDDVCGEVCADIVCDVCRGVCEDICHEVCDEVCEDVCDDICGEVCVPLEKPEATEPEPLPQSEPQPVLTQENKEICDEECEDLKKKLYKHSVAVINCMERIVEFMSGNEESKPVFFLLGQQHKQIGVNEKMFLELGGCICDVLSEYLDKETAEVWKVALEYFFLHYIFPGMEMIDL